MVVPSPAPGVWWGLLVYGFVRAFRQVAFFYANVKRRETLAFV